MMSGRNFQGLKDQAEGAAKDAGKKDLMPFCIAVGDISAAFAYRNQNLKLCSWLLGCFISRERLPLFFLFLEIKFGALPEEDSKLPTSSQAWAIASTHPKLPQYLLSIAQALLLPKQIFKPSVF